MGWTPPPADLDNYTVKDNTDRPGSSAAGCGQGVCTNKTWLGREEMAWICNQDDGCWGFIFDKGKGYGGWLIGTNGLTAEKTGITNRALYQKKSTAWRKAKDPDTNMDGVLSNDLRKTKFKVCQYEGGTDCNAGKAVWTGAPTGISCGGASLGVNDSVAYKVPLGFKWMISNDNIGQSEVEYWANRGLNTAGYFVFDNPEYHGMRNKADCMLLQNIGFDVDANWDSMVNKGVDPADAFMIKGNWCKKAENIDNVKCAQFYAMPEAKTAGYNYDITKFYLCKADPNWFNTTSCRTAFNNAVKGTDQSLRQQAKDAITNYCNTPAGETQADGLCGCANVMKYASQCLTTKAGIPGCRELKATVGDLPGGAQVAFADKFCASDVCVTQALGNAALLPDYTPGKQCPNIAQCVQDFRNASFQGSQIDASCKNTINITGVAPPAPAAAPVAPAPAPAPAPAASTPAAAASTPAAAASTPAAASPTPAAAGKTDFMSTYLDTPGKQYAAMGFIFVLFMCCLYFMFGGSSQPQMDPMMLAMLAR